MSDENRLLLIWIVAMIFVVAIAAYAQRKITAPPPPRVVVGKINDPGWGQ